MSNADEIIKLKKLLEDGTLTQEEFNIEKDKVLGTKVDDSKKRVSKKQYKTLDNFRTVLSKNKAEVGFEIEEIFEGLSDDAILSYTYLVLPLGNFEINDITKEFDECKDIPNWSNKDYVDLWRYISIPFIWSLILYTDNTVRFDSNGFYKPTMFGLSKEYLSTSKLVEYINLIPDIKENIDKAMSDVYESDKKFDKDVATINKKFEKAFQTCKTQTEIEDFWNTLTLYEKRLSYSVHLNYFSLPNKNKESYQELRPKIESFEKVVQEIRKEDETLHSE